MLFDKRRYVQCVQCGATWGLGEEDLRPVCPGCGKEEVRPVPFRFTLKGFILLGTFALFAAIIVAGVMARRVRTSADPRRPIPTEAQAEEPGAAEAAPLPPARVGGIPCGVCNGDGRIDAADRDRTMPPFTSAPLGRCPACEGKGGLSR